MRWSRRTTRCSCVSPIADTRWFRTCIRQADRIWFFARADARPSTPLLPPEEPSPARQFRLVDVILLHHGMDRKAATTDEWRVACDAARLFHWRGLEDADAARLARVIARKSDRPCALRRRRAGLCAYRRGAGAARSGAAVRHDRRHVDGRGRSPRARRWAGTTTRSNGASARRSSRAIRSAITCCRSSASCAAGASMTGCRRISAKR